VALRGELVADEQDGPEHNQHDGGEEVAHLQAEDGVGRVHHPVLGRVAHRRQDREDDRDGDRLAELHHHGGEGVEHARALLAGAQPDLVAHVCDHRLDEEEEGARAEADREHAREGRPEELRRDRHQDALRDRIEQRGDLDRARLAEALGDAGPERRPDQPGPHVGDEQQAHDVVGEALRVGEEEQVDRPGEAGAEHQQQLGDDQPVHRGRGDHREVVLE
jgi:hypothetical protein